MCPARFFARLCGGKRLKYRHSTDAMGAKTTFGGTRAMSARCLMGANDAPSSGKEGNLISD